MEAAQLDRDIRALDPSNPVQMAWMNSDLHSNCFAAVIPTAQYDLTNDEFATVAATKLNERRYAQPRFKLSAALGSKARK